jgi:hypothetical protein
VFRSVGVAYTYLHALAPAGSRPCSLLNDTEQRFRLWLVTPRTLSTKAWHSSSAVTASRSMLCWGFGRRF